MAEVNRKKGESFEAMLRRFSRKIQLSGRMLQAKKIRFRQSNKSKRLLKDKALKKEAFRKKTDYLLKIGKITEEELQFRGRRGRRRGR